MENDTVMNFYDEIEREFKAAGIAGGIRPVPEELRPTREDYAELERRIAIRIHENEVMMAESKWLADRIPLG